MLTSTGKKRKTLAADQEQLFRIIQSIPSPKAETFKLWMAHVASRRIDQMQDPELSIEQAVEDYKRLGYDEKWIRQRLQSIRVKVKSKDSDIFVNAKKEDQKPVGHRVLSGRVLFWPPTEGKMKNFSYLCPTF